MIDCVILGGGVIGCALARELARCGARVTLLEARSGVALAASGAAIGTLSYSPSAEMPEAWHRLAAPALAAHRALAAELATEISAPPAWHWPGRLNVVTTNEAEKYSRARLKADIAALDPAEAQRAAWQWLDKKPLHELEPALGPKAQGASVNPGMGWVDGAHLTRALADAARQYGATILQNSAVERLLWEGGRVVGALMGERAVRAAAVIVAAGAWSSHLEPRLALPVEPVRGQALHIDLSDIGLTLPLIRHLIGGEGIYLIPEGTGVAVGSTHERVGFQEGLTVGGISKLLSRATKLLPALEAAAWSRVRLWSGLRPTTPDTLPILGPDPRAPGLWWATGHFRSGILLAPITAALLAGSILEGTPLDERLSVARFTQEG
ncbi:MAG: FAD-dependent oxidoreductase [Ardenticatenales bacterium]|nr:FAD-dependent oxidoreductase [Ardenticatenales bacterium]